MPRRESYNDTFTGEADSGIRAILEGDNEEETAELRRILLNIIKNELTPRQKQIIMLYYFKKTDIVTIGRELDTAGGFCRNGEGKNENLQDPPLLRQDQMIRSYK